MRALNFSVSRVITPISWCYNVQIDGILLFAERSCLSKTGSSLEHPPYRRQPYFQRTGEPEI